ncbi:retrotransposon protein, putative, ty1-copia subclass [Tanacetum coccineum]
MDFPEFYKELEAEFFGAGAKLMGLQLLQLELRLGKNPSRSFRPVKSAEILWQFWTSYSLRVSLAQDGSWSNAMSLIWSKNCTSLAIGERHLPIESTIAIGSTDVMYRSLRIVLINDQKLHHLEEALPEAPPATATIVVRNAYACRVSEQQEVSCLMLAFHACKQGEGQSFSTYVLKMKAYLDQIDHLGYRMPLVLGVNVILTSLSKDYDQFVQNYNKHCMGKTIPKLHAMLKLAEKGIPKKALVILVVRQGQIQKPKPQAQCKGKQQEIQAQLGFYFLWHCSLGHINKKRIAKMQHDGLLLSIDDKSFDVCVSCISGKMARKLFTHASERADDLLGLIHSDEHELGDHGEPPNYRATLSDPNNAEMESIKDNQVWNLVDLPPNCKTVGSKWLFKKKTDIDGNIHTCKAHLVAKGFTQTYGVDYEETFSSIVDIKAIRILIAIAAYYDYEIWQMDVKTTFLNGHLNEDVYMVQPEGLCILSILDEY